MSQSVLFSSKMSSSSYNVWETKKIEPFGATSLYDTGIREPCKNNINTTATSMNIGWNLGTNFYQPTKHLVVVNVDGLPGLGITDALYYLKLCLQNSHWKVLCVTLNEALYTWFKREADCPTLLYDVSRKDKSLSRQVVDMDDSAPIGTVNRWLQQNPKDRNCPIKPVLAERYNERGIVEQLYKKCWQLNSKVDENERKDAAFCLGNMLASKLLNLLQSECKSWMIYDNEKGFLTNSKIWYEDSRNMVVLVEGIPSLMAVRLSKSLDENPDTSSLTESCRWNELFRIENECRRYCEEELKGQWVEIHCTYDKNIKSWLQFWESFVKAERMNYEVIATTISGGTWRFNEAELAQMNRKQSLQTSEAKRHSSNIVLLENDTVLTETRIIFATLAYEMSLRQIKNPKCEVVTFKTTPTFGSCRMKIAAHCDRIQDNCASLAKGVQTALLATSSDFHQGPPMMTTKAAASDCCPEKLEDLTLNIEEIVD